MKNKFFSIITALLLTLALVSHGTLAIDATASESGICVCSVDSEGDVLDGVDDKTPLIP